MVNLIHYEDAARLAFSILRGDGAAPGSHRGRVFIGTDNVPVSFADMMVACISSGVFQGNVTFTGTEAEATSKGKRVTNHETRKALGGWLPKYPSFKQFMEAGGNDFYSQSGLF